MPFKNLEAKRRYQREWRAARRTAFFVDKVCNYCGTAHELTLDHIDPNTKISHKIWSWSEDGDIYSDLVRGVRGV